MFLLYTETLFSDGVIGGVGGWVGVQEEAARERLCPVINWF